MSDATAASIIFGLWFLAFLGTVMCFPKKERGLDLLPLIFVAPLSFIIMLSYRIANPLSGSIEQDRRTVTLTEAPSHETYSQYLKSIIEGD